MGAKDLVSVECLEGSDIRESLCDAIKIYHSIYSQDHHTAFIPVNWSDTEQSVGEYRQWAGVEKGGLASRLE